MITGILPIEDRMYDGRILGTQYVPYIHNYIYIIMDITQSINIPVIIGIQSIQDGM